MYHCLQHVFIPFRSICSRMCPLFFAVLLLYQRMHRRARSNSNNPPPTPKAMNRVLPPLWVVVEVVVVVVLAWMAGGKTNRVVAPHKRVNNESKRSQRVIQYVLNFQVKNQLCKSIALWGYHCNLDRRLTTSCATHWIWVLRAGADWVDRGVDWRGDDRGEIARHNSDC